MKPPKGTSLLRGKTSLQLCIDCRNRSTSATCARDADTKREDWLSGYSPKPSTSSDQNRILHGRSPAVGSRFQFLAKSVKWFPRCAGLNVRGAWGSAPSS